MWNDGGRTRRSEFTIQPRLLARPAVPINLKEPAVSLKAVPKRPKKVIEECRKKAAESILRFADKKLPVRHADADEARDEVTANGYSVVQEVPAATEEDGEETPECNCEMCKLIRKWDAET